MKKILITVILLLCCTSGFASRIQDAQVQDFETIQKNIAAYHPSHWAEAGKIAAEALRPEALILESDHTPVDVILRRTQALIDHLKTDSKQKELEALKR